MRFIQVGDTIFNKDKIEEITIDKKNITVIYQQMDKVFKRTFTFGTATKAASTFRELSGRINIG